MKTVAFILFLSLSLASCMPDEDLPIKNVGEAPEYFIECYCQPGKYLSLAATTVLPVSENLEIDFTREMSVIIHTDRDIELTHTLYTLPGSEFIYNYGSKERLQVNGLDSINLSITTKDGKYVHASTSIPSSVKIQDYKIQENEAIISFYTSMEVNENYYIYSVETIRADSVASKQTCYLDYGEYSPGSLAEKSLVLPKIPDAEKIIFNLKRITRTNYDYQVSLSAANIANQSSITTPVPLKGNLQGALGIFTCYTEDKVTVSL